MTITHFRHGIIALLSIILMLNAQLTQAQTISKPLVIGESLEIISKELNETRRINVYLPDGYITEQARTYPVIYMLDGGIAEDFLHIAGLVQVSIANASMRPFILVGIENTVRRRDLTGPSNSAQDLKQIPNLGGAQLFRQFISNELIPEIQQRYRTTAERALIGESLAGLFTLECLFHAPDLFQTYIAIDPSLWWNNQALTSQFAEKLRNHPQLAKTVYIASAGQNEMANVANKFAEMLKESPAQALHWTYENYPKETHASIYHPAAMKAFRQLFSPTVKTH